MSITWTAPARAPDASSPIAPAAMSGTPLPSTSPTPATDEPNASPAARSGPPGAVPFTSAVRRTEPPLPMSITWTAPAFSANESSASAPAAMSGTPLPSMSPTPAADQPKLSPAARSGPPGVVALTSTARRTEPFLPMSSRWTAPPTPPPKAPTAMSGTPLPSTSPTPATDEPNASPAARSGPPGVVALTSTVRHAAPSLPMSITWTVPAPPLAASRYGAPTAMSGTPSPLMSPIPPTRRRSTTVAVQPRPVPFTSTARRTAPSLPMSSVCNEARTTLFSCWSAEPTARSGTPLPSMSPTRAIDTPDAPRRGSAGGGGAVPFEVTADLIASISMRTPGGYGLPPLSPSPAAPPRRTGPSPISMPVAFVSDRSMAESKSNASVPAARSRSGVWSSRSGCAQAAVPAPAAAPRAARAATAARAGALGMPGLAPRRGAGAGAPYSPSPPPVAAPRKMHASPQPGTVPRTKPHLPASACPGVPLLGVLRRAPPAFGRPGAAPGPAGP